MYRIVVAALLLAGTNSTTLAETIEYPLALSPSQVSLGTMVMGSPGSSDTANWDNLVLNIDFFYPQFDPALGNLTHAAFDFGGAVGISADILYAPAPGLNQAGQNINFSIKGILQDPLGSTSTMDVATTNETVSIFPTATPVSIPFGSDVLVGPLTLVPPGELDSFIGTGTKRLVFSAVFDGEATLSNGQAAVTPIATLALPSVRLLYEYQVPEPASWCLMALGAATLTACSRPR